MASKDSDRTGTSMTLPAQRPVAMPVPAAERRAGITIGANHTRVPSWLLRFILPLLTHAEQAVMLEILDRTLGFASEKGAATRKQWDRISLSQFIEGSTATAYKNGEERCYTYGLGTGLSRASVVKALQSLENKQLVRVSYECPTTISKSGRAKGCGWNEADDDHLTRPEIDPKTKAYKCPRCQRTLSKAYALSPLTPGFVKRFLTAHHPSKQEWQFDPELGRFYTVVGAAPNAEPVADPREAIAEIQQQLWFPELVQRIVGDANSVLKTKAMKDTRMLKGFYRPALAMQEEGFPREAVKYGFEQVLKRKIAAQTHNQNWHGYAKACATGWMERNTTARGKQAVQAEQQAVSIEETLGKCAELNKGGDRDQARRMLHELLASSLDHAAAEFSGDRSLARRHILEAFKRGLADYRSVLDYTVSTDYLSDWDWHTDEQQRT